MEFLDRVLDNGIRVVCCSAPLETVAISVGVGYGSIDESPRTNGSAHFLEHMLFKGTTRRTWKQLNDQVSEMGAYDNAQTSRESTTYLMSGYRGYFPRLLEMISDIVTNSTLPEKEFELERGPIINENMMFEDNPLFLYWDHMPRLLFKGQPAGMPVGGDNEKTIKKITRDQLFSLYSKNYAPRNIVVAVYGGVDRLRAFSEVKKRFAPFSKRYGGNSRRPMGFRQRRCSTLLERPSIKQARMGIGFKTREFSIDNAREHVALSVATELLRYRVFEEVREKRGLSYDPSVMYTSNSTFGFIEAEAGVEPKNIDTTKKILLSEFERAVDGGFTAQEIERTKKGLIVKTKVMRDDSTDMSMTLSELYLRGADIKYLNSFPAMVKAVKREEIHEACRRYIDTDKYGLVVLRPKAKG